MQTPHDSSRPAFRLLAPFKKLDVHKAKARQTLLGNYSIPVLASIILQLSGNVLSMALLYVEGGLGLFSAILVTFVCTVLTRVLSIGLCKISYDIAIGKQPDLRDLLMGYKIHTDTIIRIVAFQVLIFELWYIPFVLITTSFRTTFLIHHSLTAGTVFLIILSVIALIVLLIAMLSFELRYILSALIYVNTPERNAYDILTESRYLMEGHRKDVAMMFLSFVGYLILGALSLGIALFWITPYMLETLTFFYITLRDQNAQASGTTHDSSEAAD